jgi:hypothetical protein
VIRSAAPIVPSIVGIVAQPLPGQLLGVQRQDVVVGTVGWWPSLSEKRRSRWHDTSDAFGPGGPAVQTRPAASVAADVAARLKRDAYALIGRSSRHPGREMYDTGYRLFHRKVNAIFCRLN